jgi:hypothetical protein
MDGLWIPNTSAWLRPSMDFHFCGGRCLRVFWRGVKGLRHPLPYAWHKWGFYAFGVALIGFMYWPTTEAN